MWTGVTGEMEASTSGSLRTRSRARADPLWTVQDMLLLVNEIAVVESDCQNALSTYQKWSMIAENCTALEVVRNSSQCRRKWESLVHEYKLIKQWEENTKNDSYWSLGFQQRKETGLPVDLDKELYEAIDNFTKLQDQADTDPEDDPEAAEIDVLDAGESGPKPKRARRSTVPKKITVERKQPVLEDDFEKPVPVFEAMKQIPADCKPKRQRHRSAPQTGNCEEKKQPTGEDEPEESVPGAEEIKQISTDCKPTRLRHQATPEKGNIDEMNIPKPEDEHEDSTPIVEEMALRECVPFANIIEQNPTNCKPRKLKGKVAEKKQPRPEEDLESIIPVVEEDMEEFLDDPKPQRGRRRSNPKKIFSKGKKQSRLKKEIERPDPRVQEMVQILTEKLKENSELIHAILDGNLTETVVDQSADQRDEDTLNTESARCRADKLVSCLVDLRKNLEQLCNVVEE